ncbi:ThiJ/PfpI [Penicillium chermesinum]|nr:ThiJ/PfpI [Penicillium chermesinum]
MPARKALIAVTSASASLFNGKETTGLFISEALHPFKALVAAGFEVDLTSETGSYTPDWLSLQPDFLNGSDLETWKDLDSDFRKKLDNMPKASEVDGSHALQEIAEQVWANGGVVSSVCHGPAIFANVLDRSTGAHLVTGKRITGFTTEAESTMGIMSELRGWGSEMVEELADRLGANYERSAGIWDDFHVVDGNLVTGQNPASASSTAKAAIEVFEKL